MARSSTALLLGVFLVAGSASARSLHQQSGGDQPGNDNNGSSAAAAAAAAAGSASAAGAASGGSAAAAAAAAAGSSLEIDFVRHLGIYSVLHGASLCNRSLCLHSRCRSAIDGYYIAQLDVNLLITRMRDLIRRSSYLSVSSVPMVSLFVICSIFKSDASRRTHCGNH